MRPSTLIAALLLVAPPALGEVFTARDTFRFSLSRASLVATPAAELEVTPLGVRALFGVKRASRDGDFQQQEVTVLNEPYDLRDGYGGKWRLWVRHVNGPVVIVELVRHRSVERLSSQAFRVEQITVNELPADVTFGALTLNADGTYRLGRSSGRYTRDEGGVTLDGPAARWGRGFYSLDLDALTFQFDLGGSRWAVKYRINPSLARR